MLQRKPRRNVNSRRARSTPRRTTGQQRKLSARSGDKSVPVATSRLMKNTSARVVEYKDSKVVTKREQVATINGSVGFEVTKFVTNPGVAAGFPWLAPIANQYQHYRFTKLSYHFVTRVGSVTPGSIIMAPEYDASTGAPTTEQQLTSYMGATENVAWESMDCHLSQAALNALGNRKYIRNGPIVGDIKTYDGASFYFGTIGNPDATAIGKLWVEYTVVLYVPQTTLYAPISTNTVSSFCFQNDQLITEGGNTVLNLAVHGPQTESVSVTAAHRLTFNARGVYMVTGYYGIYSDATGSISISNRIISSADGGVGDFNVWNCPGPGGQDSAVVCTAEAGGILTAEGMLPIHFSVFNSITSGGPPYVYFQLTESDGTLLDTIRMRSGIITVTRLQ